MIRLFGHLDYFAGLIFLVAIIALMLAKRLPSPEGFEHFLTSLNSKGGNILILSFFTYVSLQQTIRWLYHMIEMVNDHRLNESNSIATLGIQFLTTTAFGMFAGALISTLTGISTKGNNNETTTNSTTTTVSKPADPTAPSV